MIFNISQSSLLPRSLFKSVAEEGQRSLNVERCALYIDEDGDATSLWALAKNWTPSQEQLNDCVNRAKVDPEQLPPAVLATVGGSIGGGEGMEGKTLLDVRKLEDRFSEMKFRRFKLPTQKEYIEPHELSGLLQRMLGFGSGKLEKKKIKQNGT